VGGVIVHIKALKLHPLVSYPREKREALKMWEGSRYEATTFNKNQTNLFAEGRENNTQSEND
jgi:hypothetical protein